MATQNLTPEAISGSLAIMQDLFKQVGPLIVERAGKVAAYTDKHDGSPVTATDIEVEKILQNELARRSPGTPIFGEETGYGNDLTGTYWLVDPIDGTKDFIENVPQFTTMGVLIQNDQAVAALIYNPSTSDIYTAQQGKGTYKNGVRLDLRTTPLPRTALCKPKFIEEINGMLAPKDVTCVPAPRGGGFGFTMVLDGIAAARFNLHGGGYTHDYAPGALLIREAGGALIPILDDSYTYESRSFVACHPDLEPVLLPYKARLRELENQNDRERHANSAAPVMPA
jgi:myo-inositol-1(or 4)-monophosphatase